MVDTIALLDDISIFDVIRIVKIKLDYNLTIPFINEIHNGYIFTCTFVFKGENRDLSILYRNNENVYISIGAWGNSVEIFKTILNHSGGILTAKDSEEEKAYRIKKIIDYKKIPKEIVKSWLFLLKNYFEKIKNKLDEIDFTIEKYSEFISILFVLKI